MRVFNCDHCGHLVFLTVCNACIAAVRWRFLPDALTMAALTPAPQDGADLWRRRAGRGRRRVPVPHVPQPYGSPNLQLCGARQDAAELCVSLPPDPRMPDLSSLRTWVAGCRSEAAKRRLVPTGRLGWSPRPAAPSPVFEFWLRCRAAARADGPQQRHHHLNVAGPRRR